MFVRKHNSRRVKSITETLGKTFGRALKEDPQLARNLAFIDAGYPELAEKNTPEYRRMRANEEKIAIAALNIIENNPEIMKMLTAARARQWIKELAGGPRATSGAATDQKSYQPFLAGVIAILKIISRAGTEPGLLSEDEIERRVNPGAIENAVKLWEINSQKRPLGVSGKILAGHKGKLVLVTESEFRALALQKRLEPVINVLGPGAPSESKQQTDVEPVPPQAPNPPLAKSSPLQIPKGGAKSSNGQPGDGTAGSILPEEFVRRLRQEADSGITEANLLWDFLRTAKYPQVKLMLKPYRSQTNLKPYVKQIGSQQGEGFVKRVIELVNDAARVNTK